MRNMTRDEKKPTAKPKKVPLFITDPSTIADEDIDEWAQKMAEHVSRVTGLPLVDDDLEISDTSST